MKYKILFIILTTFGTLAGCQPSPVYHEIVITPALDTVEFTFYYNNLQGKDTLTSNTRRYHPPVVPPTSSSSTFTPSVIPTSDIDIVGAGRGANQFYGGNGTQSPLPGTSNFDYLDDDRRFQWKELQSAVGKYNWTNLDNAINTAIARGGKLSFRVMTCDNSQQIFPSFIESGNQPDFNSETYLGNYITFIVAMSNHLKTTKSSLGFPLINGVYKIDMGGIGNWSEMHWSGLSVAVITAANGKRLINAWTINFPDTWLMVTISGLTNNSSLGADLARALLEAKNNLGPVGIRCDHLGWINTFAFDMNPAKYWASDFLPAIKDRWKTSPEAGELMNDLGGVNSSNPYSDLVNEVNSLHLSQFSNNNFCRLKSSGASASQIASSDNNIRAASKLTGYRISISKAVITTDSSGTHLTITWNNSGNAPTYENWDLYIIAGTQQIKSSFNIKTLLPGTGTSTDNIPSGNYSLSIIIKDPSGVRKPFTLVNTGRGTDGSYKIGDK